MMKYTSTRNDSLSLNSKEAILKGLSEDGGLFIPTEINRINDINELKDLSYRQLAKYIISLFFDDIAIDVCIEKAYGNNFDDYEITPTKKINDVYFLELFHGPTSAFKDLALQFLPHILIKCNNDDKDIVILSATSGDTGKAALEGFKDVYGTRILVLYPNKMVSLIQERQMTTTGGANTNVIAINGNFDDCQRIVKNILEEDIKGIHLTSANSINIARLIPQVVYYFKAYLDLLKNNEIKNEEKVDFLVPTGNFGDILAGYLAKEMGLPINKLVCASNINNVLTDFFNTGIYDINRPFYNTMSPSIDILISSNLERLLYFKSKDSKLIIELMDSLKKDKRYKIEDKLLKSLNEDFIALYSNEEENKYIIKEYYEKYHYLIDPHTATAASVANKYESSFKKIILATASPFKFSKDVYKSLTNKEIDDNLNAMDVLSEYTGFDIPNNLKALKELKPRFNEVLNKEDIELIKNKLEENNV